MSAGLIEFTKHLGHLTPALQFLVLVVEKQCCACVLTAVMGDLLDAQVQKKPGKELERDVSLLGQVEQLYCVDNLFLRHLQHDEHDTNTKV